jgi:hypothetical protein
MPFFERRGAFTRREAPDSYDLSGERFRRFRPTPVSSVAAAFTASALSDLDLFLF